MATEVDNEWANVESSDRDDLCDLLKEVKGRNTEHRAALRIKELEAKLAAKCPLPEQSKTRLQ